MTFFLSKKQLYFERDKVRFLSLDFIRKSLAMLKVVAVALISLAT